MKPWNRDDSCAIALAQLRATQRRANKSQTDPFDAFYRIYITGLLGAFGFYLSLGLVDDVTVDDNAVNWLSTDGPGWIGLVAAVIIAAGARSGANGGPLALDELEIHHVLCSPLERSQVLAAPTRRLVLTTAGLSSILGAAGGELASRQLMGGQADWVLAGLGTGAAIGISTVGAALVAQGSRRRGQIVSSIALFAMFWAVVDTIIGTATAPTSVYGDLALWPLNRSWTPAIAGVATLVLSIWGMRRVGALSIERAHRRSRLVRQIRFAIAQQDIRSLILLRRQLGFETPRNRPWVRIRGGSRLEARVPVLVRDVRSYARWPAMRLIRVVGMAVVAGLTLSAMWHGTTALIAVVGVTFYVTAIEVIEPLSQELDHPGILELIPTEPGNVLLTHAISATGAMTMLWVIAGGVATALTLDWNLGSAIAVAAVPASAAAVAAAALSITRFDSPALVPSPETEGPRLLLRLLWPPALATAGTIPILIARNAVTRGESSLSSTVSTATWVALLAALALTWIRFRDQVGESLTQTNGQLP